MAKSALIALLALGTVGELAYVTQIRPYTQAAVTQAREMCVPNVVEPIAEEAKLQQPRVHQIHWTASAARQNNLDELFNEMTTGDELRYGDVRIVGTTVKPQHWTPRYDTWKHKAGLQQLPTSTCDCPGYAKLDVLLGDKPLARGIEIAYGSVNLGGGFQMAPNYNLDDILGMAGLPAAQRQEIITKNATKEF